MVEWALVSFHLILYWITRLVSPWMNVRCWVMGLSFGVLVWKADTSWHARFVSLICFLWSGREMAGYPSLVGEARDRIAQHFRCSSFSSKGAFYSIWCLDVFIHIHLHSFSRRSKHDPKQLAEQWRYMFSCVCVLRGYQTHDFGVVTVLLKHCVTCMVWTSTVPPRTETHNLGHRRRVCQQGR